jgi:argininosuccinate lyase
MLPHKKNPDIAELVRGKSGRLIGNLTGFLATLKALPLAYNRDLQEDKEPIFDALDTLISSLGALSGLISASTFNAESMRAGADSPENSATDLAEYLVRAQVPFRDAHAQVGALVNESIEKGITLREVVANTKGFGPDAVALLDKGVAVTNRHSPGGAGPEPVAQQMVLAQQHRAHLTKWLSD